MSIWLDDDAVTQTVIIGPFIDETDGITPLTGLTIAQADVRLSKNGGTFAQKGNATSCTHTENGFYSCPLSTGDRSSLGYLDLHVHVATALPVWARYNIASAFYVTFGAFAANGRVDADLKAIDGSAAKANNLGTHHATSGKLTADITGNVEGTVILANSASHGGAAAVITAERLVVESTTAGEPALKLTGNTTGEAIEAIGGNAGHGIAVSSGGGNTQGINVLGAGTGSGILAASGSGASGSGMKLTSIATNGDGLTVQGAGTGPGLASTGGATGPGMTANGGGTGGEGLSCNGTGGSANSSGINITQIEGNGAAATLLRDNLNATLAISLKAGTLSTSQFSTTATQLDGVFRDRVFMFDSDTATAELRLQAKTITGFLNTNGVFTCDPFTTTPVATDTGRVI